ncbi:MAG TPA: M23 family metallopeptidase [Bacteroidota bacterium]|nr:M23 family metallopeptidase [Bacteroidota bacterium]
MIIKRPKYYRADDRMQLSEVKWIRLKIAISIIVAVVLILTGVLSINRFAHDPLGLGYDRVQALTHDNELLQQQLAGLKSKIEDLNSSVDKLGTDGNHLRLVVDLPQIGKDITSAGTGGAVQQPEFNLSSAEEAGVLQSTLSALQKLNGEIKVQQQSYAEIVNKYEFNKGYFSALPALKPMDGFYSTNGFGLRMHPVLGIFKTHEGLDIINDVGTPVYASGDGVITMAGQSGGGYGTMVVIDHGYDYQTLYAHLSKVLVHEGQRVRRGDLIAKSGKTGLVSGPHLHYEVRYKGLCKNPVDFFFDDLNPKDYRSGLASR